MSEGAIQWKFDSQVDGKGEVQESWPKDPEKLNGLYASSRKLAALHRRQAGLLEEMADGARVTLRKVLGRCQHYTTSRWWPYGEKFYCTMWKGHDGDHDLPDDQRRAATPIKPPPSPSVGA